MKKKLQIVEFENLAGRKVREDHQIGGQIFLMDEYQLSPVRDYGFTASDNLFIEVLAGKGYVVVDGVRHDVNGHSLIVYLKGQQITVRVQGKKTVQRGAAFSDEFLEDMYRSSFRFNDIRASLLLNPVVSLEGEQSYGLNTYITVLKHIAEQADNPHNLMCAKHITLALFYGPLHGVFKKKLDEDISRTPLVSSNFFSLVEEHYREQSGLEYYADKLNISKQYLHRCVSDSTGKAPGYWIDYYKVSYAKRCLTNMDMSVLEVATDLNYAGLPQFCKFFRKQTGMTPTQFRQSLL